MVSDDNLARMFDVNSLVEADFDEYSLKWCVVSLSDVIARGKRLEASVFDIEAQRAWKLIKNGKYSFIPLDGKNGLIKNAFYPGRFKRIYVNPNYGMPFFLPSQMTDVYPRPEKHISRLTNCDFDELQLKPETLLLTRSGTIGTISYVSKATEGLVFSDDVIRVTFSNEFDLGYVYTFLKSKTGNLLLKTNGYGSVITHLEPDHLAEIPIPNAPIELRKHINELIKHSYALRDESNDHIDQATDLLVQQLQLPPIDELEDLSTPLDAYSTKLSQINGRLDASYHVPIVSKIEGHLKRYAAEVVTISDPRISEDVILPGRFKRVYVEEGYGVTFFSGKDIAELDPNDKKYLSFSKHNEKIKNELTIRENMILVTCSGSIGKTALVPKHWDGWTMTHDIIRFVPKRNMEGYAYIWLNTDYANRILNSLAYGSVVQHIEKEHFNLAIIPLLEDQSIQKQINNLALLANAKRYEAYMLEQEALHVMNNEVIYAHESHV